MPHITKVLGTEVGIQFQGVQDKSSSTGQYPVVGLFIGKFRRGRFDKPMTIHKGNIKAILGYDPNNPDYAAVSDALAAGLPSVQVVRLQGGSCEPSELIVPVNNFIYDGVSGLSTLMEIYIDDVLFRTVLNEWEASDVSSWWDMTQSSSLDSAYSQTQIFLGYYLGIGYGFSLAMEFQGYLLTRMGTSNDDRTLYYMDVYGGIPLADGNFIITGYPNTIEKYQELTGSEWDAEYDKLLLKKVDVKFKVNPNTSNGYIDFVEMLWGEDVVVHGCANYYNNAG